MMKRIISYFMIMTMMIFCISGCGLLSNKTAQETMSNASTEDESESKEENKQENNITEDKSDKAAEDTYEESQQNVKSAEKKVVVIDPGHGNHSNHEKEKQSPDSDIMKIKDGGGAEGIKSKTPEYKIAMNVALKLKTLLEQKNYTVIMTKTDDSDSPGNIKRAEVGNENNADLEIRIHCDSSDNQSAHGASMLVPDKCGYAVNISDISTKYGQTILDSLVNKCGMQNRGVVTRNDMTGFNWSKVPVVLVEMGFLSNPDEDYKLNQEDYQNKLAEGLCDGIVSALN